MNYTPTNEMRRAAGRSTRYGSSVYMPRTNCAAARVDSGRATSGVPVFDDLGSFGHFFLGVISGHAIARRKYRAAALIVSGFALYQLNEIEPTRNTVGDFLEFGLGLAGLLALRGAKCIGA